MLSSDNTAKQHKLFHAIREKIVQQLWPISGKLPSTRKLAEELNISRNTVIAAYEQLVDEGYIESRTGSGFYVSLELPDHYLPAYPIQRPKPVQTNTNKINDAFAPGVPDLEFFPISKWQKLVDIHSARVALLGNQNVQGSSELRSALSDYLATSRSVNCSPQQIIITSGAQQALSIALMATLKPNDSVLMENPGYTQTRKIVDLLGFHFEPVQVKEKEGLDLSTVLNSKAKALYITPSNQYPMGTALNTERRLKLIEWAQLNDSWIIEDDYDSEFQFAHRPYTSLQGLSAQISQQSQVIYVSSFSKVMFNSLRIGYLVVPESLVEQCLVIKDALTGDSPAHTQAALADFILEGHLFRHIRKMRRLYKQKHHVITQAIDLYFNGKVKIISQAAGLHITIKWYGNIDEITLSQRAKAIGIIVRPLSYYEHLDHRTRNWHGAVLGFGNTNADKIDSKIKQISELFDV